MCLYCNMGDFEFRHNPPWHPQQYPVWPTSVPLPVYPLQPIVPWDLAKLREYHDLLKAIKELEDKIGCPCEPNKADYLGLLKKRIAALQAEKEREEGARTRGD